MRLAVPGLLGTITSLFTGISNDPSYLFVGGASEAGFPEIGTPSQHGLSHGAFAYLIKPATTEDLEVALDKIKSYVTPHTKRLLVIEDNGRGFDARTASTGLGWSSIGARVDQVGGTWDISSALGQGTRLSVRLPLDAPPSDGDAAAPSARVRYDLHSSSRARLDTSSHQPPTPPRSILEDLRYPRDR